MFANQPKIIGKVLRLVYRTLATHLIRNGYIKLRSTRVRSR